MLVLFMVLFQNPIEIKWFYNFRKITGENRIFGNIMVS